MSRTPSLPPRPGLFRATLAGAGATLAQAFQILRGDARSTGDTASPNGLYGATIIDSEVQWDMLHLRGHGYLVVTDCQYAGERTELVPFEGLIELHFTLCGNAEISDGLASERGSDFDMIACAVGQGASYEVNLQRGRRRSVAIYATREYFECFLDPATPAASALSRQLAEVGHGQVYFRRTRATLAQVDMLERLLANPYADKRRWLYAESVATELLCSAIDTWGADETEARHTVLRARDVQILEHARQLVLRSPAATLTIEQLARRVGTNSAKLKSGFRILFGCTVFELALKARMDVALQLLQDSRQTIADIATAVGYSHASSFTTAFQRNFGFSPSEVRRLAAAPARGETHPSRFGSPTNPP